MSDKKGVQESGNEVRLTNLRSQLEEIDLKREELSSELSTITKLGFKVQGAIEILESIERESEQKKEEKK